MGTPPRTKPRWNSFKINDQDLQEAGLINELRQYHIYIPNETKDLINLH